MTGFLQRVLRGERGSEDALESVVAHLRVLLNAREGDSLTAPSYGLGDFTDLFHSYPSSARQLEDAIARTIERFEPRLTQVVVRAVESTDPLSLRFELRARLKEGRQMLRLETSIDSRGRVRVG